MGEEATMSTQEIADMTWKTHFSVVRTLEFLVKEWVIISPAHRVLVSQNRQEIKIYDLNKEDSINLVARLSPKFTAMIIKRWQELENENKSRLPQTYIEALSELIESVKAKELAESKSLLLEAKIEKDKPLVAFGNAVSWAVSSVKVEDFIKAVYPELKNKMWRNSCFRWLRDNKFLTINNRPYQNYIDMGIFEVKESLIATPKGTMNVFTCLVTGKWQIYLLDKLNTI